MLDELRALQNKMSRHGLGGGGVTESETPRPREIATGSDGAERSHLCNPLPKSQPGERRASCSSWWGG